MDKEIILTEPPKWLEEFKTDSVPINGLDKKMIRVACMALLMNNPQALEELLSEKKVTKEFLNG